MATEITSPGGRRFIKALVIAGIAFVLVSALVKRLVDIKLYSDAVKQIVIVEGESTRDSNYVGGPGVIAENKAFLGGRSLELSTSEEIGGGYYARYTFTAPRDAVYNLFIAGTPPGPLETGSPWHSPYSISIDGSPKKDLTEEIVVRQSPRYYRHNYVAGGYYFMKLMAIPLKKGPHELAVTIDKKRRQDGKYTVYIDAFILSPKDLAPEVDVGKIPKDIFGD